MRCSPVLKPLLQDLQKGRRQEQLPLPGFISQVPVIQQGEKLIQIREFQDRKPGHREAFLLLAACADCSYNRHAGIGFQPDLTRCAVAWKGGSTVEHHIHFLFTESHDHPLENLPISWKRKLTGDDGFSQSHLCFILSAKHKQQADTQKNEIVPKPEQCPHPA